jgi:heme/copper-type cytochrome/quinol oxidase subunit 2
MLSNLLFLFKSIFLSYKYKFKKDERNKHLTFTFWYRLLKSKIKLFILNVKLYNAKFWKAYYGVRTFLFTRGTHWEWYVLLGYLWLLFFWEAETLLRWFLDIPTGSFSDLLHFPDVVTVYSFSLVALHNLVMWYIFFVLGVVCWSILGIVRDFSWRKPSLETNLPLLFHVTNASNFIVFLKAIFYFVFFRAFYFSSYYWAAYVEESFFFIEEFLAYQFSHLRAVLLGKTKELKGWEERLVEYDKYYEDNILRFYFSSLLIGTKVYFNDYDRTFSVLKMSFTDVFNLLLGKKTDLFLFSFSSKAEFLNDDFSRLLRSLRFKHSSLLELIWAGFPIVIIGFILLPSLILLYSLDEELDPYITVKVIGHQWYWTYEIDASITEKYLDLSSNSYGSAFLDAVALEFSTLKTLFYGIPTKQTNHVALEHYLQDKYIYKTRFYSYSFDSYLTVEEELSKGARRLLEVDNHLFVPSNVVIRFLVTSSDVLHSWSVPEAGIKVDAVPGRLNQMVTWFVSPGSYYGQCSELCGVGHGFMPIAVDVMFYDEWLEMFKKKADLISETTLGEES